MLRAKRRNQSRLLSTRNFHTSVERKNEAPHVSVCGATWAAHMNIIIIIIRQAVIEVLQAGFCVSGCKRGTLEMFWGNLSVSKGSERRRSAGGTVGQCSASSSRWGNTSWRRFCPVWRVEVAVRRLTGFRAVNAAGQCSVCHQSLPSADTWTQHGAGGRCLWTGPTSHLHYLNFIIKKG